MGDGEMPKEVIHSRHEGSNDNPEPTLQISWGRESSHVQVATIMPDGAELKPTPEGNGWFIQLSRAGINDAIRVLRKARDQAYGRDE